MSRNNNSSNNKVHRVDGVQSELDELQRRFRDMEAKHRLFNDDSIQTIRMQRTKIGKLKGENETLKEELALETRQAKTSSTTHRSHHNSALTKLQESGEMYQRKIEVERRRIGELESQIKKMEESILQQRSDMGGVNANRETSRTIQKNIRLLENRLDKALVKYNEALGHNKKLRETIDNLRRERVVFDGIYRKLEGDLLSIKNEMASIIGEANTAYETRDYAQSEMLRLKEGSEKEQKQFEHEWKELTKLIDQDKKMKDFLSNKDREKMNDAVVTSVLEQEQNLRKKLSKGAWSIVKDKAHIHMSQEKVKSYEDAFEKIANATKISEIDVLVNTFIASEEQNFKLFNQVNKLSNEIEKYEESIATTKLEISGVSASDSASDDGSKAAAANNSSGDDSSTAGAGAGECGAVDQRKRILTGLKAQIAETETQTETYKRKHEQSLRTMSSLKGGISQILDIVGENEGMKDMIQTTGVTESNVMGILGAIEQKTNELVCNVLALNNENNSGTDLPQASSINHAQAQLNGNNSMAADKPQLGDKDAEAAALGVGIGAAHLQPLVVAPASIFADDFSDAASEEDEEPFSQEQNAPNSEKK